MTYPERLTVLDLQSVLAQVVKPEATYKIDGWILIAMADELLRFKGIQRNGARLDPAPARAPLDGQLELFTEA